MPLLIPISFRIDTQRLKGALFFLRICCILMVGFFIVRFGSWPFDQKHPRRAFITWGEDLSTNSVNIHVAKADGAPGFEGIVLDLAKSFGASGNQTLATKTPVDNWHSEWDSVSRLSSLLSELFMTRFTVISVQPAHWKLVIPNHSTRRLPTARRS